MPDITYRLLKKENPYWSEITKEDLEKYDVEETFHANIMFYQIGSYIEHRENGPAVIYADGDYSYMKNGELHNINGPAQNICSTLYYFTINKII